MFAAWHVLPPMTNKHQLLLRPSCHSLQRGDLSKELCPRLCRASKQDRTRGYIRDHACLRADLAASADTQMSRHRSLAADLNEILEDRRSRYSNLRHNHTAASELNIVADLYKIIDACSGTDGRITCRSSVDRGIRTDFHIVLNDDPPKLRDAQEAGLCGGKAEAFLTDPCARIDVDARPQQSVTDAGVRADPTVAADRHAFANRHKLLRYDTRRQFRPAPLSQHRGRFPPKRPPALPYRPLRTDGFLDEVPAWGGTTRRRAPNLRRSPS